MKIATTPLDGLCEILVTPSLDERGLFARTCDSRFFHANGLNSNWVQFSTSYNTRRGTLRGLHYQSAPYGEAKLVRCTRGRIFDVAVDIRPGSATLYNWYGVELTCEERNALYIPQGFAHGFITLEDDCEVFYQMSTEYVADAARGIRFDDPRIAIDWPLPPLCISGRDLDFPRLGE